MSVSLPVQGRRTRFLQRLEICMSEERADAASGKNVISSAIQLLLPAVVGV